MGNANGRPKAPKCRKCKKALYKSPTKGDPVKKSDKYAWCRNNNCGNFGKALKESRFKIGDVIETVPNDVPPKPPEDSEPAAVKTARERIRDVLEAVHRQYDHNIIGLTLAIVSQETGSHKAANALISEYDLDKKFGIHPIEEAT